jgi:hypothetical protein
MQREDAIDRVYSHIGSTPFSGVSSGCVTSGPMARSGGDGGGGGGMTSAEAHPQYTYSAAIQLFVLCGPALSLYMPLPSVRLYEQPWKQLYAECFVHVCGKYSMSITCPFVTENAMSRHASKLSSGRHL